MDWFKYVWLVVLIIAYIILTVRAIKDAVGYIKKNGFILGLEYASIYSKWFDGWVCIHAALLGALFFASFIYFITSL